MSLTLSKGRWAFCALTGKGSKMSGSKFALVAVAGVIAFASPAFAKTIHPSRTSTQRLYNSAVVPPASSPVDNPYIAPYENTYSGGSLPDVREIY
jgi:hypothetical protein